jgi:hypothetical protein
VGIEADGAQSNRRAEPADASTQDQNPTDLRHGEPPNCSSKEPALPDKSAILTVTTLLAFGMLAP